MRNDCLMREKCSFLQLLICLKYATILRKKTVSQPIRLLSCVHYEAIAFNVIFFAVVILRLPFIHPSTHSFISLHYCLFIHKHKHTHEESLSFFRAVDFHFFCAKIIIFITSVPLPYITILFASSSFILYCHSAYKKVKTCFFVANKEHFLDL